MAANFPPGSSGGGAPAPTGYIDITTIGTVGTADDTAVFSAALTASSTAKKWLVIPANTTVTVDTWTIATSNIYLRGEPGALIQHKAGAYDGIMVRNGQSPRYSNFHVKDLTFQGNGVAASTITGATWNGSSGTVTLVDASAFTSSRPGNMQVTVSTDLSSFIYSGRTGNVLTGVTTDVTSKIGMNATQPGQKIAIRLNNMDDISVENCWFFDFYGTAIHTIGCQRLRTNGNRIERCCSPGGWNAINLGYDAINSDYTNYGYVWAEDNYITDVPTAGIVSSCTTSTLIGGDANFKNKVVIANNIIRNASGWTGIAMEGGYNEDAVVTGNQIYNSLIGVTISRGNSPSTPTVNGAQNVSQGGSVLVNTTNAWYPKGSIQITFADGTTKVVAYTSKDATHFFGLDSAVNFAGGETLRSATSSNRRMIVSDNLIDCETVAGAYGIDSVGEFVTIQGNNIRSSSTGIITGAGAPGKMNDGNIISDNTITIANTDTAAVPQGIMFNSQNGGLCVNNSITRETDRTLSGMGYGIVVQSCNDSIIGFNKIKKSGFAGVRVYDSTSMQFVDNDIIDPGSQATTSAAGQTQAFSFGGGGATGSWDCLVARNKSRWSGSGYQYNHFIWIENFGGQEIVVKENDARGYQTAFKIDQQSASTTVNGSGSPVIAVSGDPLPVASLTNIPKVGGLVTVNGVPQMYTRAANNILYGISPGGTFPDGSTVSITGNSIVLDYGNIIERRPIYATTNGARRELWGTAVPASGTWAVGDKMWNTTPSAGGNAGWICIAAGTPGTWQTFGQAGGSSGRLDAALAARGFLSMTSDYRVISAQYTTVSQDLRASSLYLNAGDVITNLWVGVATAGVGTTPTNVWLGLYQMNVANAPQVGITADVAASANWTSIGKKFFPLTSPYTVSTSGLYGVAHLSNGVFGTTAVKLAQGASAGFWQGSNPTGAPLANQVSAQATLPAPMTYSSTEGTYVWFAVN